MLCTVHTLFPPDLHDYHLVDVWDIFCTSVYLMGKSSSQISNVSSGLLKELWDLSDSVSLPVKWGEWYSPLVGDIIIKLRDIYEIGSTVLIHSNLINEHSVSVSRRFIFPLIRNIFCSWKLISRGQICVCGLWIWGWILASIIFHLDVVDCLFPGGVPSS